MANNRKSKPESAATEAERYRAAKEKHPDMMLLFRVGDFYELYEQDAETAAKVIGLTLTTRDGALMAGFPHHQLEIYLGKLLREELRVAVCERSESPREVKRTEEKSAKPPRKHAPADSQVKSNGGLKMQAHRHGLLAACRLVSAAIPVGSGKPVLRNIKAIANGDRCTLMATDLEIAVRLDVRGIHVLQPGQALLPSARLIAILSETHDEDLHIEAGKHITVHGATNEFEMHADDPATFPDVPTFADKAYHEITANVLREMIRRTVFAAASENVRFGATTGVLWELSEEQATLVATDGRRLAIMTSPAKAVNGHATDAKTVPVVPAKAMNLLARLLTNPDETVRVAFRKNEVLIQVGETVLYSRLVEGRFPEYKQVIPKDGAQSANLVAGPLNTAIRQASIMSDGEGRVDLRFAKQRLSVKAQGAESGKSNVELPVDYAGKESKIAFNPSYVTDMLRVLEPDASMTMNLNGDRPALFKTPNYQYVVVPLVESKS